MEILWVINSTSLNIIKRTQLSDNAQVTLPNVKRERRDAPFFFWKRSSVFSYPKYIFSNA